MLWEVERLLNECTELPQILLMENVTQVHGTKNKEHFDEWLAFLESKGYKNYWKDLNAKNFGIPQNRNRCFMVSVLGEYSYEFPKEFPLALRLKDMLEDSVDEKFYLSAKMAKYLHTITEKNIARGNGNIYSPCNVDDCSKCITTKEGQRVKDNFIEEPIRLGYIPYPNSDKPHQSNTFYDANAVSPTLDTCTGENRQVKIAEPRIVGGIGEQNYGSQYRQGNRVYDSNAIAMSLLAQPVGNAGGNSYLYKTNDLRIRKLTPRECWRLMGFDDADFDKAAQYNSNTQLYKQAGNSIVVDVLCYIFKQML
jgi:DNA (cytosine-5)-methyltransferase 1